MLGFFYSLFKKNFFYKCRNLLPSVAVHLCRPHACIQCLCMRTCVEEFWSVSLSRCSTKHRTVYTPTCAKHCSRFYSKAVQQAPLALRPWLAHPSPLPRHPQTHPLMGPWPCWMSMYLHDTLESCRRCRVSELRSEWRSPSQEDGVCAHMCACTCVHSSTLGFLHAPSNLQYSHSSCSGFVK